MERVNPFAAGDQVTIDPTNDRMVNHSSPRYQTVYEIVAVQGQTCWIKQVPGNRDRMNTDLGTVKYWDDLKKVGS